MNNLKEVTYNNNWNSEIRCEPVNDFDNRFRDFKDIEAVRKNCWDCVADCIEWKGVYLGECEGC